MEGIIPLYKPKGMTSHDCVFKLRKILKMKRIGHTGTLDPDVTGVLPICIGRATKVAEYITDAGKAYEGEVTIGYLNLYRRCFWRSNRRKKVDRIISRSEIMQVLQRIDRNDYSNTPDVFSSKSEWEKTI